MKQSWKFRTICEVLREINDLIQEDNEQNAKVRVLLEEAFNMSKRIVAKLYEYNKQSCADFWERNPNRKRAIEEELRRGLNYKPIKYQKNFDQQDGTEIAGENDQEEMDKK